MVHRARGARASAAGLSRSETGLASKSDFSALKRQEATKPTISPDEVDQRLARVEPKPNVSFWFRLVSPALSWLRFVSLAPGSYSFHHQ